MPLPWAVCFSGYLAFCRAGVGGTAPLCTGWCGGWGPPGRRPPRLCRVPRRPPWTVVALPATCCVPSVNRERALAFKTLQKLRPCAAAARWPTSCCASHRALRTRRALRT
eukprot:1681532-Prymnesium_polylepis.1